MENSQELLRFQRYCKLDGSQASASAGKRNGKPFPILPPSSTEPPEPADETPLWEQTRLYVNLNPIERRTWKKILLGQSVNSIAHEEGVSRQAIYGRIAGNSKAQGGMIAKNFHVLVWWLARQRQYGTR